ncbi:MAG TPA: hypothetical protein VMR41_05915 [Patescibacteria group bacterium]|nr:hypothetical protein [Patescibacteria group bacterium]
MAVEIETSSSRPVRVITYNSQRWQNKLAVDNFVYLLKKRNASLSLIQESSTLDGQNAEQILRPYLGDEWQIESPTQPGMENLATIWHKKRFPLKNTSTQMEPLPEPEYEWWHDLYNSRENSPQMAALVTKGKLDGEEIGIVNTHLDIRGGQTHRLTELKIIARIIEQFNKMIFGGDLNTPFLKKEQLEEIHSVLGNDVVDLTAHIPWTHRMFISPDKDMSWLFQKTLNFFNLLGIPDYQKLDYLFGKKFRAKTVRRHNKKGADHFPVEADGYILP